MRVLGSALQLAGLVAVSGGAFLIAAWAGWIVVGVGVFAVGFQLERLGN